jgi:hypothetical protein
MLNNIKSLKQTEKLVAATLPPKENASWLFTVRKKRLLFTLTGMVLTFFDKPFS